MNLEQRAEKIFDEYRKKNQDNHKVLDIYSQFWARGFDPDDHDFYMNEYIPKELHYLCSKNKMKLVYDLEDIGYEDYLNDKASSKTVIS